MPEIKFQSISPHVHYLPPDPTTDRPLLGYVAGRRGALLVDAGNSPAHAGLVLRAAAEADLPELTYVVLTHWHWDHVFGTAALARPTFAHQETARIVTRMAGLDWSDLALDQRVAEGTEIAFCRDMMKAELPDRNRLVLRPPEFTFTHHVELDLGGVTCRLEHVGGDHSPDSTVVSVPEDGVMFLGDCIYPDLYHGPRRYTTACLFPLLARLLAEPAEFYLPSHHTEPLTRSQMQAEAVLLTSIGRAVEALAGEAGQVDPDAILAALPARLGRPLDSDEREIAEEFIAGLLLPQVGSPL